MSKVLVIGSGIIGLFTAYTLNCKGYKVDVIDKKRSLGGGISGNNAGVLHLIQQPFDSIKSILTRIGAKKYRELSNLFGYEIYETELYIVGYNLIDKIYLDIISSILKKEGFNLSRHRNEGILEPPLTRNIKYFLRIEGYGVVDPIIVLKRIAEYIGDRGVDIKFSKYEYDSEGYDYIVVAAGPETYNIGEKLDDEVPKHRYALGVMVNIDLNINSIYTHPPNPLKRYTKGGAAIPKQGYTLLGPGFKWVESPDEAPSEHDIKQVYKRFEKLFNEPPKILSISYGVRPINYPKDDFIIRKKGKYIFTYGIDSPGFTAAPIIGEIISNMIVDDRRYIELTRDNLERYI